MRLQEGKVSLRLDVVDYQFPELTDQKWDSDWLFLRLRLECGDHVWERIDPSVMTFDLQHLADWLAEAADHSEIFAAWRHERLTTRMFFTEPNLSFEVLNGHPSGLPISLRVYLAAEYLPPFAELLDHVAEEVDEVWIDFGVNEGELRELVQALAESLAEFPIRVGQSISAPQSDLN